MDIVLKNLVAIYCYVYLDDVVIFSQTAKNTRRDWSRYFTASTGPTFN